MVTAQVQTAQRTPWPPAICRTTLGKTTERETGRGWLIVLAHGVVYIHSAPAAICPHVEWALANVLGTRVSLQWTPQSAAPGQLRASVSWQAAPGSAGRIAQALATWQMLRFEVTEDATPGADGEQICHIPGRGLWRSAISASGDVVIGEAQVAAILAKATCLDDARAKLQAVLGADVDRELEPYRRAGDGSAITWLHQVG